jgi:hypothetical protein
VPVRNFASDSVQGTSEVSENLALFGGGKLTVERKAKKRMQKALEDVADWKHGRRLKRQQTISTIHKHYNVAFKNILYKIFCAKVRMFYLLKICGVLGSRIATEGISVQNVASDQNCEMGRTLRFENS